MLPGVLAVFTGTSASIPGMNQRLVPARGRQRGGRVVAAKLHTLSSRGHVAA